MTDQQQAGNVSVVLETGNVAARVVIPAGADPQTLTLQLLTALARERGVEMTPAAERALDAIAQRARLDPEPISEVFIRATPPEHGQPGHIEWRPGFNPEAPDEQEYQASEGKVDYYAHRSFVRVSRENQVATIHEPTPGTDGRDVTGRTLSANPGKSLAITIGQGMLKLDDGRLVAQSDGLLRFDGKKIMVDPVLEIQGTVDFSTGNIDFDGDVVIRRDIRDKFKVQATQNITIDGLIDASHIVCGGNLSARRGVAGRGEGTLEVQGDAHIGYLDSVKGHVGGTLHFAREVMHCAVSVGGDLVSDLGRVIGGRMSVAGNVRIAQLGSESETPTELHLTVVLDGASPAGEAAAELDKLQKQVVAMEKVVAGIKANPGPPNPSAAERLTELVFEIGSANQQIAKLTDRFPHLAPTEEQPIGCDSTLEILKQIHGRVSVTFGNHTVSFNDTVKGPVRIWLEGTRDVMCKFGDGEAKPIRTLTCVTDRAAA